MAWPRFSPESWLGKPDGSADIAGPSLARSLTEGEQGLGVEVEVGGGQIFVQVP